MLKTQKDTKVELVLYYEGTWHNSWNLYQYKYSWSVWKK